LDGQREVLIVVLTIIPGKSRCLAITIRPKILRESSRQAYRLKNAGRNERYI